MPCHIQWIVHRLITKPKLASIIMAEAWKLAQEKISKAQHIKRNSMTKLLKKTKFSEGDVVFLYDPSLKQKKHINLQNHSVVSMVPSRQYT